MDRARADRIFDELKNTEVSGWRIQSQLGYGKSAVVFRATKDDAQCAIKVFDQELIERFGADIQLERVNRELLLKDHIQKGLVSILDGGQCEQTGLIFVAMECLGDEWTALTKRIDDIPRSHISTIIRQLAASAKYLESLGLVHRDIKPDNIMINDGCDETILMDLGVIKPIGGHAITDEDGRQFIGTLQYSSPEFLLREESDEVEDWRAINFYQIGAVMHDLIMRAPIFTDFLNPYARLVRAVEHVIPTVKASDVDIYTVELCKYCLIKKPDVRLSLVSWESFDNLGAPDSGDRQAVRKRVRKRQLAHCEPVRFEDTQQLLRKGERLLQSSIQLLESIVRAACASNDEFPNIEIIQSDCEGQVRRFVLLFSPSPRHALEKYISIVFELSLLDLDSVVFELGSGTHVSADRLSTEALRDIEVATIYRGLLEDSSSTADIVEDRLYLALDGAF